MNERGNASWLFSLSFDMFIHRKQRTEWRWNFRLLSSITFRRRHRRRLISQCNGNCSVPLSLVSSTLPLFRLGARFIHVFFFFISNTQNPSIVIAISLQLFVVAQQSVTWYCVLSKRHTTKRVYAFPQYSRRATQLDWVLSPNFFWPAAPFAIYSSYVISVFYSLVPYFRIYIWSPQWLWWQKKGNKTATWAGKSSGESWKIASPKTMRWNIFSHSRKTSRYSDKQVVSCEYYRWSIINLFQIESNFFEQK